MITRERIEYRVPAKDLLKALFFCAAVLAGCIFAASVWGQRASMGVQTYRYYAAVFLGTPISGLLTVAILVELILRPACWRLDHEGLWDRALFRVRLLPWSAIESVAVTITKNGRQVEVLASSNPIDRRPFEELRRRYGRGLRLVESGTKAQELESRLNDDAVEVAKEIAARCAAAGNPIEPILAPGVLDPMWESQSPAKGRMRRLVA